MNEYVFKVELDNKTDTIKTFGTNVIEAMDDIVGIDGVSIIYDAICTETKTKYLMDVYNVGELRDVRNIFKDNDFKTALIKLKEKDIIEMFFTTEDGTIIN